MRSKKEIRAEVEEELRNKGLLARVTPKDIERQVDGRYHWERLVSEAEDYEKDHGSARIEFIASPDDEYCKLCWEMNGKSITLDELKAIKNKWACRCALVLPEDDE